MFIDRDESGKIKGCYACRQCDGQEELADDHPDIAAYRDLPRKKMEEAASARALLARRANALAAGSIDDKLEALKIRLDLLGG